jgi:hypothetical protein
MSLQGGRLLFPTKQSPNNMRLLLEDSQRHNPIGR